MSKNKGCLLGLLDLIFKPKKKEKPASTKKPEAYIYPQYGTPILAPEQTQYQQMPAQQYQQMQYQQQYQSAPVYNQQYTAYATPPYQYNQQPQIQKQYEYKRKYLLTQKELYFYKELKKVADKLNLSVLAKIRMADLVEPKSQGKDYYGEFGKIKAKHVDFALCDPNTLYVLLLIELDDSTHDTVKGKTRDTFVEEVYSATGYGLYRARNTYKLEENITAIMSTIRR